MNQAEEPQFVPRRVYLAGLAGLRDQLKARLSRTAPEQDKEQGASAGELAERIESLKAAHSIDATPQRVAQKQSFAEEPVTARIRRRFSQDEPADGRVQESADLTPAEHEARERR